MNAVKVMTGNGFVRGYARNYAYFVAQLFRPYTTKDGRLLWRATGVVAGPFRSIAKAEREGRDLAMRENAEFVAGYGSLHNKPVETAHAAAV